MANLSTLIKRLVALLTENIEHMQRVGELDRALMVPRTTLLADLAQEFALTERELVEAAEARGFAVLGGGPGRNRERRVLLKHAAMLGEELGRDGQDKFKATTVRLRGATQEAPLLSEMSST
jgi:hypothetical protein